MSIVQNNDVMKTQELKTHLLTENSNALKITDKTSVWLNL